MIQYTYNVGKYVYVFAPPIDDYNNIIITYNKSNIIE